MSNQPDNASESPAHLRLWVQGKIDLLEQRIEMENKNLQDKVSDIYEELAKKVSMDEFKPVRLAVYSLLSTIVLAVVMALLQEVLRVKT